ncbi:MAG TPA: GTPase domain-containing protein [Nannocystaceae bacterium]|nr:GTPase domain-containing protein [Nannocystaceae bacterium]
MIRIVYDGPPEAGKTTSVRALAAGFGREVYTPEEHAGRTVWFDWLEHVGGRFDGKPIRCEIASVPGQARWSRRRNHFIDGADAIVFVADTSSWGWSASAARFRRLQQRIARREGAKVGVVFQANRRDLPDAVPLAIVRQHVGASNVAVIESIATDGTGIRESFVFAVRLALDRVREEQRAGLLPMREQEVSVEDLLAELRSVDRDGPQLVAAPQPPASPLPRAPSHELPTGCVWPPIEGRIVLREAARADSRTCPDFAGDFEAELAPGWRAHSASTAVFASLDDARTELVGWARQHAAVQPFLSRQRCIALAETGDGRWRLWQVVHREPSLRDLLREDALPADRIARLIDHSTRLIAEARSARAGESLGLPCTLDTIGVSELGRPVYVGIVAATQAGADASDEEIAHELAALVHRRHGSARDQLHAALRSAPPSEVGAPGSQVRERLLELLGS